MKRCQLALAVKETEYLRRFADYVRGSSFGERWQVAAFTNAEACRQYVKQGYAVDLVAAEPELLMELQDKLPDVPAVALVGKLGESPFERELVQYQPLPALLKAMTELHAALSGYRNRQAAGREGERVRVIAVHSASGGVGKTAAALHLVHAAGSRDLKAFYLNLERWNAVQLLVSDQAESSGAGADNGLSGLLYAVKAQPGQWEQLVQWLSGRVLYHPVLKGDYLPPFANPDDRLTLAADDAASWRVRAATTLSSSIWTTGWTSCIWPFWNAPTASSPSSAANGARCTSIGFYPDTGCRNGERVTGTSRASRSSSATAASARRITAGNRRKRRMARTCRRRSCRKFRNGETAPERRCCPRPLTGRRRPGFFAG